MGYIVTTSEIKAVGRSKEGGFSYRFIYLPLEDTFVCH